MKHLLLPAFLILANFIQASGLPQNTTPSHQELRFDTVQQLHAYNLHAFEQIRDAFGFSRVIRIYNNPLEQKKLFVGNQPVKSISLVSNALSKSLNTNTLELKAKLQKVGSTGNAHPASHYSVVSNAQEEKAYRSLSPEKPILREGGKVWAAMVAKQQCLKCHNTYKVGSVIGAFVYEVAPQPKINKDKELEEAAKAVLLEVSMK